MPIPVQAIQIDGGADASNTIRPNQALGGQTPAECLANLTAEQTPASQTSWTRTMGGHRTGQPIASGLLARMGLLP